MKATAKRPRKQGRLYVESKVKRIMESLGMDFERFKREYETQRGLRGPRLRPPTEQEGKAVDKFLLTGDFMQLQKALGVKSRQTASAVVTRVIAYRTREKRAGAVSPRPKAQRSG